MATQLIIEAGEGGDDAALFMTELASAISKASSVTPTFTSGSARFEADPQHL